MFSLSRRAALPRPVRRIAVGLAALSVACAGLAALPTTGALASSGSASKAAARGAPYDLVTANGIVYNEGGAGWYGDEKGHQLPSPVASIAVLPSGRGYWLAAQSGAVYSFGDARPYGSLAGRLNWRQAIVAIHSTPDGKGYWLIGRNGSIRAFGDAGAIVRQSYQLGSRVKPIVGADVTPSGHGAWLTNPQGDVYTVGAATAYGSLAGRRTGSPVAAIAATPDGRGYWLITSHGGLFGFGDATKERLGVRTSAPVVGIAPAASPSAYLAVTSAGTVLPGGDTASPAASPRVVLGSGDRVAEIATAARPAAVFGGVPAGSVGYDVNWPQCASPGSSSAGPLPVLSSRSVAVVGVDGWAQNSYNPCLAGERAWAARASTPYQLYMFINSPGSPSDGDQTGPGGTCATRSGAAWQRCLAYNYGYNAAKAAVSYAAAAGAHSAMWWLDVENGSCATGEWNAASNGQWWSCDLWLNAVTISGAVAGLRSDHVTAGIYCTPQQWAEITNGYRFPGIPIWIAGAYWTSPPYPANYNYPPASENAAFCAGSYDFAGGHPVLLQETPGNNGYPYDPDYAC